MVLMREALQNHFGLSFKVCSHVPSFSPFNGPLFWIVLWLIGVFTLQKNGPLNGLIGLKPIFLPVFLRVAMGTKSVKLLVVKLLLFNKHPVKIETSSAFVFWALNLKKNESPSLQKVSYMQKKKDLCSFLYDDAGGGTKVVLGASYQCFT